MEFTRHCPRVITGKPWNGKIKKLARGYFWWPGLNKQTL